MPTTLVRVDIDVKGVAHVRDRFGRFITNIGKAQDEDARAIARIFSDWLRISLRNATEKGGWTGRLDLSLARIQGSNKRYFIKIPLYGIYLNQMKAHRVSVSRPPLNEWIADNLPGYDAQYILVKPHPWIEDGLRWGRANAREMMQRDRVKQEIDKLRR